MDELSAIVTTCKESADDLKQQILSTALELESVKNLARESQEKENKLLNLLQVAYKERDEAKSELQKILNNMNHSFAPVEQVPNVVQPESPIFIPQNANTGISELNSLFEAYINPLSCDPSLADSLFDAFPSPDLSNINDSSHMNFLNQPLIEEPIRTTMSMPTGVISSFDVDTRIDCIAEGKSLPEIGKLLQAVMDAGQLLNNLFVAGPPLPRWRNPPTMQRLKMSARGCKEILAGFSEKPVAMASTSSNHLNAISYPGSSHQTYSPAMLEFSNDPPITPCKSSRPPLDSNSYFDQQIPNAKRCRLQ